MKKILGAFLLAFLLIACSSDDDSGSGSYDESEPNDSAATANEFTADGSVNSAEINPVGDYDGFYYTVTPGAQYTVEVTWKSGRNLDLVLKCYDQDVNTIGSVDDYEERESESGTLSAGSSTTGVYLVVSDYWDEYKGSYTISVTPISSGGQSGIGKVESSLSGNNENGSVKDEKKTEHWK